MAEFFDKVIVGLNKGVTSVKEGSRTMVEKAKINTSIRETEAKKNQALMQLGTLAYSLQSQGVINVEQFGEIYNTAAECDNTINSLKQQLQALESAEAEAPAPAAPVEQAVVVESATPPEPAEPIEADVPVAEEAVAAVVCSSCGAELKNGARFCGKCGTPVA